MRDPLSDKVIDSFSGTKSVKIEYSGDVEATTMEDVKKVQQIVSRTTGIDQSMTVYAKQTPGSVIFTFLIPQTKLLQ